MPGKYLFSAILLMSLLLITLTGCLNSGSKTAANMESATPEAAVAEILNGWRQNSSPVFVVGPTGSISPDETADTGSKHYVSFKDLSGEIWSLAIGDIIYQSPEKANVYAYYYSISADQGGLKIVFVMIKDNGAWYIDDFIVEALPAAVVVGTGIKGVITDRETSLAVSGARIEAYLADTTTLAGAAVTEANGFYSILDLAPGNYYLVVARDGYEPYTISGIVVNEI